MYFTQTPNIQMMNITMLYSNKHKNKSGVIKNPPPTPNIPDNTPTIPPNPNKRKAFTETSAMGR